MGIVAAFKTGKAAEISLWYPSLVKTCERMAMHDFGALRWGIRRGSGQTPMEVMLKAMHLTIASGLLSR